MKFLICEFANGNVAAFVEFAALESYAAILHVTSPRPTRSLGSYLARRTERSLNLEAGWVDRDHPIEPVDVPCGRRGRTERALELYASFERLSPKERGAVELLIEKLRAGMCDVRRTNVARGVPRL